MKSARLLPAALAVALTTLACGEEFNSASAGSGSGGTESRSSVGKDSGGEASDVSDAGEPAVGGTHATGYDPTLGAGAGTGGSAVVEEPSIPLYGLELWLRADEGVSQNGGAVSGWKDGSEQGHDALQTDLTPRPKLALGALAGKPALVFDGVDDFLELPPLHADISGGVSMFIAFQQDEVGACGAWFEASNGRETQELHFGDWQKSIIYEIAESWINDTKYPLLLGTPQVTSVVHQQSQMVEVRTNGNAVAEGKVTLPPANLVRELVYVAKTLYTDCAYFKGSIGELILYSRPVTNQELLDIEAYLQNKWSCCGQ